MFLNIIYLVADNYYEQQLSVVVHNFPVELQQGNLEVDLEVDIGLVDTLVLGVDTGWDIVLEGNPFEGTGGEQEGQVFEVLVVAFIENQIVIFFYYYIHNDTIESI